MKEAAAFSPAEGTMSGKTVLVFGTFDHLHEGHRYFLLRAKSLGNRLVVSVARDRFVHLFKGKFPKNNERDRMAGLRKSGLADGVYLSDAIPGSYRILRKVEPDLICLGYDQDALEENLRRWLEHKRWRIPLMKLDRKIHCGQLSLETSS